MVKYPTQVTYKPNLQKTGGPYFWTQAARLAIGFLLLMSVEAIFAKDAQRIASLSLASDEILVELMPECGGLGRIVALSTFADSQTSSNIVQQAKAVKERVHSEPESLFRLKPDLVIGASFNRPELLRMVEARKIDLLTLHKFSSADDIAQHITEIGEKTSCTRPAAKLKQQFLSRLQTASSQVARRITRLILFSPDLVVMGKDTLFDDLVSRVGAVNVVSERGLIRWPKIDTDTLLSLRPDIVIILGEDSPKQRNQIQNHVAWGRLEAVKKGRFVFLDSKAAQSTSHFFANAIDELRKKLNQQP